MRSKPLLWLVVAAARAWDFPWSSTEEGWAPAEDAPRPEEDPFWVDRAPCEADTRPPRNEKWKGLWGPWFRRAFVKVHAVDAGAAPSGGGVVMRDLLFGFSLIAVLAAYAWLYARNRSRITKVGEETSLLSQTEENPFDPHNGLEITKF